MLHPSPEILTLMQDIISVDTENNWAQHIITSYYVPETILRTITDEKLWHLISIYQPLSEDFILEMRDRVSWVHVTYNQGLSETFILSNLRYLDLPSLKLRYPEIWSRNYLDTYVTLAGLRPHQKKG